jgi:hypothetical protein
MLPGTGVRITSLVSPTLEQNQILHKKTEHIEGLLVTSRPIWVDHTQVSFFLYLAGYLANEAGPVPMVLDLRIAHDRVGSSTDPTLNGHLRYPNNLDKSLNDATADKTSTEISCWLQQQSTECGIIYACYC